MRAYLEEVVGIWDVTVLPDGRVYVPGDDEYLSWPGALIQSAAAADLIVQRLTGKPSRTGFEIVKGLAKSQGVDDAERFYDEQCACIHDDATSQAVIDLAKRHTYVLKAARKNRKVRSDDALI